ncbi:MAG: TIGR03808 family TAT-translocated repetitive protein [Pseudomonadota bacterium]
MQRRQFLTLFGTGLATAGLPRPVFAQSSLETLPLRGAVSAPTYGVMPNAGTDQSVAFQQMLDRASARGEPVFLPAGYYVVGDINLPDGVVVTGVPGQTILVLGTGKSILRAMETNTVHLSHIVLDGGAARPGAGPLLFASDVTDLTLASCRFRRSATDAVELSRVSGKIVGCKFTEAKRFGLFSVDGRGLDIDRNTVSDCADGGIIVHRSRVGDDRTRITGNRIRKIAARSGGTGQWGNGINVYRADNVVVSDNMIADCAFSSIRANTTRNIQISGNRCEHSGETAIYAEFSFENAIIADNLITGGANGISVTNFNEGGRGATVSSNIVRNLTGKGPYPAMAPGFGIGIAVEADSVVAGNLIDGAPLFGINAGWGSHLRDVVVQANVIRNAGIGIGVSRADGVGQIIVASNLIDARNGAIKTHRWTEIDATDFAVSPASAPTHIKLSGNKLA